MYEVARLNGEKARFGPALYQRTLTSVEHFVHIPGHTCSKSARELKRTRLTRNAQLMSAAQGLPELHEHARMTAV
jgi:hypothetical protein